MPSRDLRMLDWSDDEIEALGEPSAQDIAEAQAWGRSITPQTVDGVNNAPDLAFAKPDPEA